MRSRPADDPQRNTAPTAAPSNTAPTMGKAASSSTASSSTASSTTMASAATKPTTTTNDAAHAARRITTKRAALAAMARDGSPWVIGGAAALSALARRRAGRLGRGDAVAVATVLAAEPFVEWAVHRYVLHGDPVQLAGRTLDLAEGHRAHHAEPERVAQILLGPRYAAANSATIALGIHAIAAAATAAFGGNRRAVTRTALVAGYGALMTYEWSHLLMHTGYRARTTWFRRLRAHHRSHHFRDERAWFGITSNLGDRLLATGPAAASALAASPALAAAPEGPPAAPATARVAPPAVPTRPAT